MRTITRFAAAILAAIGLSAFAWAEIIIDNTAALTEAAATSDKGNYGVIQFQLDDAQMRATNSETSESVTLDDTVWVKKIAVLQRSNNPTIANNTRLRIRKVLTTDPTTGFLATESDTIIAESDPLADRSGTDLTVSGAESKLRTFTFAAPVPLLKSSLYSIRPVLNGSEQDVALGLTVFTKTGTTDNLNTKIHVNTHLAYSPCVRIIAVERSKLADVGETATWSGLWPEASTETDTVGLNVTAANATLTMDTAATVAGLAIGSETAVGPLTLTGTGSLSSTTTTIATDTDVSAITASLGALSIASGKTLTMRDLVFSSITSDGGALCFKGGTVSSALLQTFNGSMTLRDDAKVTLPNQYTMTSKQRFIADSGNATLKLYNNNAADGVVDLEGDETIQVKAGATLTLKARDLGGWNGYKGANLVVAVRGERAKITADSYEGQPGCFAGRVVLADGGEIAGGSTANASLNFYGDTSTNEAYPEIYVPSGTGTWSGNLWRNKGIVVKVADGATFVLSGTLKSKDTNDKALTKVGAGEMKITAAQTENSGAYTINGGTLTFVTKNAITLSNTISGSGTVKKSGAETLTLTGTVSAPVEVAAGTLDLGTNRPTIVGIATEATLKLKATDAELANCAITFSTTMGTAPAKERFTVVKPDGTTVTLTAEPTVTDGTLTVPLPHTGGVITATGYWSTAGVSEETVVYVRGGESAESAITVTLDANLSDYTQIVVIGHVKFVTTTTQATLPTAIVLERGSVLTATASFSGAYTIPSGTTVVLDGTTAITSASALTVNGTLKTQGTVTLSGAITGAGAVNVMNGGLTLDATSATANAPRAVANPITVGLDSGNAGTLTTKGYLTLSNSSNTVKATGTLNIASGTTVLTTMGGGEGIKGNLNIASGATLKCGSGDAPLYTGSQTFDISGTLELTGETRWTISSGATIALHAGALLKGTGPASGNNYAFDFWQGGAITADGDATIEATLGDHIGGQTLTITQSAGTTTITGEVRNRLTLKAAGSGTVAYAPAAGVTATTSPLVVDTDATLKLLPAAAFTLNSTVTGAGTLVIGDGSAATAVTLARAGNGTDVTVSPKATLEVATGAPPETIVNETPKSIADGKTVKNNGTLKLTSGYGYFKIAGTGKTVVPGSDFLFGIGGANGDGPFSNGLEVPASANFRIRPWNAPRTIVAKGTALLNGSITKDKGDNTVTLQIASGTTLSGSSTFTIPVTFANDTTATMASNATFTFSSALTVPKNVTLPGTVTLTGGATLSGAGKLSGTVTLGNGVIIDATESTVSGHLQLTGTVALVDMLKVKASKLTNVLDVPTAAGLDLAKVSLTGDSIVPAGTKLTASVISSVTTLKLFVPPAMPKDNANLPEAIAGNSEIMAAIQAKAEAWLDYAPISEITSVSAKNSAGGAVSADGATLFTGLEVTVAVTPGEMKEDGTYKGTATVTYDFGVSDITVKSAQLSGDDAAQLYVVVCAKVSDGRDASAAGYANGTTVSLWLKGAAPTGVVALDADTLSAKFGITPAAGEKWFAVPVTSLDTGTNAFTVRATK